jgi:hypothetical protein
MLHVVGAARLWGTASPGTEARCATVPARGLEEPTVEEGASKCSGDGGGGGGGAGGRVAGVGVALVIFGWG